jgi:hypothetical protein
MGVRPGFTVCRMRRDADWFCSWRMSSALTLDVREESFVTLVCFETFVINQTRFHDRAVALFSGALPA